MSTTLEAAWGEFAAAVLPEDAPAEAYAAYRMVFCAGVHAVSLMTIELQDKTEAQGAVAMNQFFVDAQKYGQQWVASAHLAAVEH